MKNIKNIGANVFMIASGVSLVLATSLVSSGATGEVEASNTQRHLGAISTTIGDIGTIVNQVTPIVVALAFLFLFWNIAIFILKADDDDAREKAKQKMLWGVVAIAVISSLWGIVAFLRTAVGVTRSGDDPGAIKVPKVELK